MPFRTFRFYNGGDELPDADAVIRGEDAAVPPAVVVVKVKAARHTEVSKTAVPATLLVTKIVAQKTSITVDGHKRTLAADISAALGTHFEEAVAVLPEIDPLGPAYLVCRVLNDDNTASLKIKIEKFGAPVALLSEECEDSKPN